MRDAESMQRPISMHAGSYQPCKADALGWGFGGLEVRLRLLRRSLNCPALEGAAGLPGA